MNSNQTPAVNTGNTYQTFNIIASFAPFVVLCAFFFLAPIVPDVKLTRPKLLVTETCLYSALFLWIAASLFSGKIDFKRSFLNIPIFLYAASACLFYMFSSDKPIALNELKRSLLSVTAYVTVSNIVNSEKKRDIIFGFLLTGSFLSVLYGIMQHSGGFWRVQVPQFVRVTSTFGNPIFFAAYIIIILPAALGMTKYFKNTFVKFMLWILIIFCLAALYFTQTRAAFIALGVSAVVYVFLVIANKSKKIIFLSILAVILIVCGLATKNIWSRQQAHTLIWRDTLSMWMDRPYFGTGPGTFHIYFPKYASKELREIWPEENNIINDAHNEYIQYLSETGIVGFGIFMLLLAAFFLNALNIIKRIPGQNDKYLVAGFTAAGAGILAQNMFSVDMRFIISSVYFFAVAGFIETFNPATWNPPTKVGGGMRLRSSREDAAIEEASGFSRRSVTDDRYSISGISRYVRIAGLASCVVIAVFTFEKVFEPYIAQKKVSSTPGFFDEKILEPAKTIYELEALAAKYPNQALIYEKIAWIYSKEKNWPEAIKYFAKASELNPNSAGAFNNLGNIYFLLGDRTNAINFWNRSLRINPAQVDSRLNLAVAYYYKGKLKEASEQLKEVLKINPHNEKAIVMLKQMTE